MILRRGTVPALVAVCLLAGPPSSSAQDIPLTLDDVLARARAQAPDVIAAQARRDEAEARLLGASVLLHDNPELDTGFGGRATPTGTLLESEVGVTQFFETGGQRRARMSAAHAHGEHAAARAANTTRQTLQRAATLFYSLLHAEEAAGLARHEATVVADLASVAARRVDVGDLSVLDGNLAQASAARAQAAVLARDAASESYRGALRTLLGLNATVPLTLHGDLRDRRQYGIAELLAHAADRPDLRGSEAAEREAAADADLGRAGAWPDVGLGARYERDDGNDVGFGMVTLRLPLFDRGQARRLAAATRAGRLRASADALRQAIEVEVRTALAVYQLSADAVRTFERAALPQLSENERLAQRGFTAGELRLVDLLSIRREIVQTRQDYLDRLLAAALAGVELEAAAGVLR
jgi:cobalt-zinc-cadmium efflux system outer membrane protein